MYILIKADTTVHLNCEYLGSYPTRQEARNAMRLAWSEELERQIANGFVERDEIEYACFTGSDWGQIARPYGLEAINFYVFDTDKKED